MLTQEEVDQLRQDFADRMYGLIGDLEKTQNLINFSKKTGISLRQLSQWKNQRHLNWPHVKNLMRIALGAEVSVDWLLFGDDSKGKKKGRK